MKTENFADQADSMAGALQVRTSRHSTRGDFQMLSGSSRDVEPGDTNLPSHQKKVL